MGSKTNTSANEVFARWRIEDEELATQVDTIRQWMRELDQLGRQHFGETATRLRELRELMVTHFDRESEMVEKLGKIYRMDSPEVSAVRKQSARDHQNLLLRVDALIERLDRLEPPYNSWQEAIDDLESLVSLLEQHEANEWDSLEMLLPA